MKRFKFWLVCFLLLLSTAVFAANFTYSSGVLATSTVVIKYPVLLTDLAVYTNGSSDAVVTLYDSSTAATSGTVIGKITVLGAALNGGLFIPVPVKVSKGIYMTITGTGASAIVFWTPQ
jgi:hypothetical protein